MPTLFRFIRAVLIVAAIVGAAMVALATLVGPRTREMREPLPREFIERAGEVGE